MFSRCYFLNSSLVLKSLARRLQKHKSTNCNLPLALQVSDYCTKNNATSDLAPTCLVTSRAHQGRVFQCSVCGPIADAVADADPDRGAGGLHEVDITERTPLSIV